MAAPTWSRPPGLSLTRGSATRLHSHMHSRRGSQGDSALGSARELQALLASRCIGAGGAPPVAVPFGGCMSACRKLHRRRGGGCVPVTECKPLPRRLFCVASTMSTLVSGAQGCCGMRFSALPTSFHCLAPRLHWHLRAGQLWGGGAAKAAHAERACETACAEVAALCSCLLVGCRGFRGVFFAIALLLSPSGEHLRRHVRPHY